MTSIKLALSLDIDGSENEKENEKIDATDVYFWISDRGSEIGG